VNKAKISQAGEFEAFRRLPKYSHVPMAVIHPTAKKQKAKPPAKEAELWLIGASPERQPRPKRKEIPEELMRARDLEP